MQIIIRLVDSNRCSIIINMSLSADSSDEPKKVFKVFDISFFFLWKEKEEKLIWTSSCRVEIFGIVFNDPGNKVSSCGSMNHVVSLQDAAGTHWKPAGFCEAPTLILTAAALCWWNNTFMIHIKQLLCSAGRSPSVCSYIHLFTLL